MYAWLPPKSSDKENDMNIYEDEALEQKLEEITDLVGHLVLDILLVSLRKVVRENQIFRDFAEAKWPISQKTNPL